MDLLLPPSPAADPLAARCAAHLAQLRLYPGTAARQAQLQCWQDVLQRQDHGSATAERERLDLALRLPVGPAAQNCRDAATYAQLRAHLAAAFADIYGHQAAKQTIFDAVDTWYQDSTLPGAQANLQGIVLGLEGPPGVGKTLLLQAVGDSFASVLQRPFLRRSLATLPRAHYLTGLPLAYKSPGPGILANTLLTHGCAAPTFFFDELCSASAEVQAVLNAATDRTNNQHFFDSYFGRLPIDLSAAVFLFAYNDASKILPSLRSRLHACSMQPYESFERDHILAKICARELAKGGFRQGLSLSPAAQQAVLQAYPDGMRDFAQGLRSVLIRLHPSLPQRPARIDAEDVHWVLPQETTTVTPGPQPDTYILEAVHVDARQKLALVEGALACTVWPAKGMPLALKWWRDRLGLGTSEEFRMQRLQISFRRTRAETIVPRDRTWISISPTRSVNWNVLVGGQAAPEGVGSLCDPASGALRYTMLVQMGPYAPTA